MVSYSVQTLPCKERYTLIEVTDQGIGGYRSRYRESNDSFRNGLVSIISIGGRNNQLAKQLKLWLSLHKNCKRRFIQGAFFVIFQRSSEKFQESIYVPLALSSVTVSFQQYKIRDHL